MKKPWIWLPHAAHFICARDCKFFLATYVNGYIVSTVGELFPCESTREIIAKTRGVQLEGKGDERERDYMKKIGFDEIGCDRLYETMVFKAKKVKGKTCCPYRMKSSDNLDFKGYNEPNEAFKGHYKLCKKWESV